MFIVFDFFMIWQVVNTETFMHTSCNIHTTSLEIMLCSFQIISLEALQTYFKINKREKAQTGHFFEQLGYQGIKFTCNQSRYYNVFLYSQLAISCSPIKYDVEHNMRMTGSTEAQETPFYNSHILYFPKWLRTRLVTPMH